MGPGLMRHDWRTMVIAGVLAVRGALGFGTTSTHAQGFGGYGGASFGHGTDGCRGTYGNVGGGLPDDHPSPPWSPARRRGWREEQVHAQTGIAPNHPLSPAEARGFLAGERRQANIP